MRVVLLVGLYCASGCVGGGTRALADETARAVTAWESRTPPVDHHPVTDTSEVALTGTVRRDDLVALAIARDRGITALVWRARAALHGARAEGALPSPEAGVEVWNLPLARPYALGEAQMYMVEVRQALPAAGSLDARARARVSESGALLADCETRAQEIARRVGDAWADYVTASLHHRVHTQHLGLLGAMADAARARYAAGVPGLADAVRVQAEQARVQRSLARFEGERERAVHALNALLLRAPDAALGPPAEAVPDVPAGVPETVAPGLDALIARALRTRGELSAARHRADGAMAQAEAAHAEATWPMVSLGVSYWQDPTARPGVGTTASMSLPWVGAGPRAREAEARSRAAGERATVSQTEALVRGEVADAYARAQGAARELAVVRTASRQAAIRALEATRAVYVTGGVDLLAWVDAARGVLETAMEEADLTGELARSLAALDQAVGGPVPRTTIPAVTADGEVAR